jgi:hypothetical protein
VNVLLRGFVYSAFPTVYSPFRIWFKLKWHTDNETCLAKTRTQTWTSFARLANVIANSVNMTPKQPIALYLLTETVLAKVALVVACYQAAVQQERLKLFVRGQWKESSPRPLCPRPGPVQLLWQT